MLTVAGSTSAHHFLEGSQKSQVDGKTERGVWGGGLDLLSSTCFLHLRCSCAHDVTGYDLFLRSSDSFFALVDRILLRFSDLYRKTAERAVRKRRIPVEESAPHRGDRVQRISTLIRLRRSQ